MLTGSTAPNGRYDFAVPAFKNDPEDIDNLGVHVSLSSFNTEKMQYEHHNIFLKPEDAARLLAGLEKSVPYIRDLVQVRLDEAKAKEEADARHP